ncbi:hypothetical protein B0H13DRAFT_1862242 [Mycena leptocephala]|nr:hypothetical protein B0H13DRAFT_1862242 [Mycena leptocephala]
MAELESAQVWVKMMLFESSHGYSSTIYYPGMRFWKELSQRHPPDPFNGRHGRAVDRAVPGSTSTVGKQEKSHNGVIPGVFGEIAETPRAWGRCTGHRKAITAGTWPEWENLWLYRDWDGLRGDIFRTALKSHNGWVQRALRQLLSQNGPLQAQSDKENSGCTKSGAIMSLDGRSGGGGVVGGGSGSGGGGVGSGGGGDGGVVPGGGGGGVVERRGRVVEGYHSSRI